MSATPDANDASEAARARRAFGITAARLDMILLALNKDEVTAPEFMKELGLSRSGVERHLKVLTDQGILSGRGPEQPGGRGKVIYWSIVNPDTVENLWGVLTAELTIGIKAREKRHE